MASIWDIPFIVTDVETTGSSGQKNRIIDIGCVTLLGGQVINQYDTLINPHQFIPFYIANMTGISNEMAARAPEEWEVMTDIMEILHQPEAVFSAHSVPFDFSFVNNLVIRNSFAPLEMPTLCTLKLSRRLIATSQKKNVGDLAQYLGIHVNNRHRALGDALATAQILALLLEKAETEHGISTIEELISFHNKPARHFRASYKTFKRVEEKLNQIPKEPGVYYFLGRNKNILYVGKAKSLKDRVRSYFNEGALSSRKIADMTRRIYDIKWSTTETELAALLLESKEIKRIKPYFNSADKSYQKYMFLKLSKDDFPKFEIADTIEPDGTEYFGPFRSNGLTQNILELINKQFKLRECDGAIKPNKENQPCFYHQISRCNAPCSLLVSREEYLEELEKVKAFLSGFSEGIIAQLEEKMIKFADELEFEKASLVKNQITQLNRLFLRRQRVPTSINKNNLIVVIPVSSRDKTIEIIIIDRGKLIHQEIIGRKAPLDNLINIVRETFFIPTKRNILDYSLNDIDEIKIVSSWLNRLNGKGNFIYTENKSENSVIIEVEKTIRNFKFVEDEIQY
ncbi:MAG: DEDD exonuclease domain-containing protein [Bacteroidetes bacterium]|nr:MAG: DEDD exonuclease domain-containing protein [Bacteroidota bacterium]